ncbi:hypothetical protein COCCADRAFT_140 [Bipolaris zeicola 26-R-13]|uniref:BTB domain-containing protein n=1 Tax=Cochliobolus carbonum (strain 26-R-13) TaxID=930089 RepID=W6YP08_COCC2|nr:uncharacterized protein COCCADRAFT_140 [Bipolaris zeicola 26-R-13]EUC39395.1 hypothetical protein COCCADRAFT_140 [Bipolaris zeicola 26-R-13]
MAHRTTRKIGQKPRPKDIRKTAHNAVRRPIRFGEKLITIYAGGQGKIPFVVHEDLLCSSSGHFKKLFQQNLQSRLWDAANSEPWDAYMQWLYTGVITVHLKDLGGDDSAKYCQLLMESYELGERLEDELFQKVVLKEIVVDVMISSYAISYHNIGQVYQLTNGASTLRKFILDIARALLARQTKQNMGSEKVLAGDSSEEEDNDESSEDEDEEDESSEDEDELTYDFRNGDRSYEPGETEAEAEEDEDEDEER